MITTIIASVITGAVVAIITGFVVSKSTDKKYRMTVGSAQSQADKIIEDAKKESEDYRKEAENFRKESELAAKEETLKLKNQLEEDIKHQRTEVSKYEQRIIAKEEALDKKADAIDKKEEKIVQKELEIDSLKRDVEAIKLKHTQELERISEFTKEDAKEFLLKEVDKNILDEKARIITAAENEAKEEANKKAMDIIVNAIARCDVDHVTEATVSAVELPSEEMKGRIIGREGRNIRTFETITGVELIVDDTPEAVVISCFNPIRREVAKRALEKLLIDGRIHPARIEDMVEKSRNELNEDIKSYGEAAAMELGLNGIHPEIIKLLGRMNYRTSYGQNVLKHSIEVAKLTGLLAAELGENETLAKRAGLLHDIGKAVDFDMEGTHVEIGAELAKKYKERHVVINAIESHHDDKEADNVISVLVKCADMISAARPGARREDMEVYINRLKHLEEIADSYEGVEKSFAIQAGREVRIMVIPEKINDSEMVILANKVSREIEEELQYPGQIKVSVIRESRAVGYAK